MKGEKGGKMKARGEVGKERQRKEQEKESESEGKSSCNKCSWVSSTQSMFLDFVAKQRSNRVSSSLLASFQPSRIFNEKQLYKHVVCVHKHNRETRKMKTGSWFYPRAFHQEFLAYFLSVSYAHRRRHHHGKTEIQKKEKKGNPPGLVESGFQLHSFWAMFTEQMVEVLILPGTSISSL